MFSIDIDWPVAAELDDDACGAASSRRSLLLAYLPARSMLTNCIPQRKCLRKPFNIPKAPDVYLYVEMLDVTNQGYQILYLACNFEGKKQTFKKLPNKPPRTRSGGISFENHPV